VFSHRSARGGAGAPGRRGRYAGRRLACGKAFINKAMAFDRISQTRSGEWAVCTDWGAKAIVEEDDVEDAELIIFEAATP
jgi:hypothetical protein